MKKFTREKKLLSVHLRLLRDKYSSSFFEEKKLIEVTFSVCVHISLTDGMQFF